MSIVKVKPEHKVAYDDLCELMKKNAAQVSSLEMLAIAANMVGKIVAMQDQRAVTPREAMEVVAKNLELGNGEVIEMLAKTSGTQQ